MSTQNLIRQGSQVFNLDQLIHATFHTNPEPRLVLFFTHSWNGTTWELVEFFDAEATAMWAYLCHRAVNIPTALPTPPDQ